MSKAGLLLTFVGLEARANKPLNKIYPTLLSWHIYPHKDLTGQVPTGNSLTPWSSPLEHTSVEKVYPTSCISRGAYTCEWTPQPQGQGLSTLLGKKGELPGQSARRRMSLRSARSWKPTVSFWGNSGVPLVVYKGAYPLNASLDGQKF